MFLSVLSPLNDHPIQKWRLEVPICPGKAADLPVLDSWDNLTDFVRSMWVFAALSCRTPCDRWNNTMRTARAACQKWQLLVLIAPLLGDNNKTKNELPDPILPSSVFISDIHEISSCEKKLMLWIVPTSFRVNEKNQTNVSIRNFVPILLF